jgi:hypothetical protein
LPATPHISEIAIRKIAMKGNPLVRVPLSSLSPPNGLSLDFVYDIIRQSGNPLSRKIAPGQDISGESDPAKLYRILAVTG